MNILWISSAASFVGGCEAYILNTVKLLKNYGIKSRLLYDPLLKADRDFLEVFEEAFPLVDLQLQLPKIAHDVIYLHQLENNLQTALLAGSQAPVVKFFHDHQLFCLRGDKLPYLSNAACKVPAGCCCYPMRMTISRGSNGRLKIKTLEGLRRSQQANKNFDAYITASEFMAAEAKESGFPKGKIHPVALYPFERCRQTQSTREACLLLFAGQLIRSKGLDVLLKAMTELPKHYRLIVAGSGRQEELYKKLAKSLGIDAQVEFAGKLSQDKLTNLYTRCSCFVIPSRWPEPFGLVGIEAMQCGAPVVASSIGGIPEWLENGKNGFLVPPNDVKALANRLQMVCEDPLLMMKLGNYGKETVGIKFSSNRHALTLKSMFQNLIAEKAKRKRYTLYGGDEVENLIGQIIEEVKIVVTQCFSSQQYRSVLLIGGYGKGEGGVISRSGKEWPHNNLDLAVISRHLSKDKRKAMKAVLDRALLPITEKYQIGFDTSLIPESAMQSSMPTLLWHELYEGHKLLLGDPKFVRSLPLGDLNAVPTREFQALMANRGSLLIINDWLLNKNGLVPEHHRHIAVKHIMKTIIGFGDAWLYFLGDYHWSYCERLKRVRQQSLIPEGFKELYEQAAEFRFKPNYAAYENVNLFELMAQVRSQLAEAFLAIERLRLGLPELSAEDVVEQSLRNVWWQKRNGIRDWMKSWTGFLRPVRRLVGLSWASKIAFLRLGSRERLLTLFPLVAFGWGNEAMKMQASGYLKSRSTQPEDLAEAYLQLWGSWGDINFLRSQGEWKVK
jgi:glycosyltransferase involved in cell wall biosynthesis